MKMKPPLPVLLQDWIISLDESPTHPRELKLIQLKQPMQEMDPNSLNAEVTYKSLRAYIMAVKR